MNVPYLVSDIILYLVAAEIWLVEYCETNLQTTIYGVILFKERVGQIKLLPLHK
jgi:hypothetical protein